MTFTGILTTSPDSFRSANYTSTCIIGITDTPPPHKVIFCVSRLAGDAQRWWELQARILGKSADGEQFYPAYDKFEEKLRSRFWKDADEQIKRAQWERLKQVNFKDVKPGLGNNRLATIRAVSRSYSHPQGALLLKRVEDNA